MNASMDQNLLDFNFKDIVEAAKDVIIVTKAFPLDHPGPEIVYVNEAFTRLTGYTAEQAIGKTPRMLQAEETSLEARRAIRLALESRTPVRIPIKNYTKNGNEYWLDLSILPLRNSQNELTHFVAIEREITEQKKLELELQKLSTTDPLTGLLNRRSFEEKLKRFYQRFRKEEMTYSAIALDLDHFKSINDQYGHQAGDIVLKKIGHLCSQFFYRDDLVARTGGEEFVIILKNQDLKSAMNRAELLRREIATIRIPLTQTELSFTASLGVAEVHSDDKTLHDIINQADKALYQAKESGRNRVCHFSAETAGIDS